MSNTFTDRDGDVWHRCEQSGVVEFAGRLWRIGLDDRIEFKWSWCETSKWETHNGVWRTNNCAREAIAALWPEAERPNSTTPLLVAAPTPRRIIQLTASGKSLAALCSDDSVWIITDELCWVRLPAIPQGDQ